MPTAVSDKEQTKIAKKLEALKLREDIPPALLDLVARTIDLQLAARKQSRAPSLNDMELADAEKVRQGAPLLDRQAFPFDREQSATLFSELLDMVLSSCDGPLKDGAEILTAAIDAEEFDLDEAFDQFLKGEDAFFLEWAQKTPQAPRLVSFLVNSSLAPFLELVASSLQAEKDDSRVWNYGHCPVCGSLPLVGRLLGKEGARHLTCSFCHTEYRVKRLQCPFCDEEDAKKLKYFQAENENGYQVHVCDSCQMYIKTIDFRNLERPSHPLLDDLESLFLDLLAQKQGYMRPSLSAWGF